MLVKTSFLLFVLSIFAMVERNLSIDQGSYDQLRKSIASIQNSCGEICDHSISGQPGKYFDFIQKKVNCNDLFSNPFIDDPLQFESPPMKLPKWLREDFSYTGRVPIIYRTHCMGQLSTYYDDFTDTSTHWNHWNQSIFDVINNGAKNGKIVGPYEQKNAEVISDCMKHQMNLQNKHVLVIGSSFPWIESMVLRHGAKKVLSIDYKKIVSDHPQIHAISLNELSQAFLNQTLPQFDALISYSSLEHSGLGRYGDNLNPWGDLITMARGWCLLRPGGRALIGVPTMREDAILFNACRIYGPVQYPHLFANWEQVYSNLDYSVADEVKKYCHWGYQPVVVAEKPKIK